MRGLLLIALAWSLTGCATMRKDNHELALRQVAISFNNGVRWRRCPQAAALVAAEEREDFLDRCEELAPRLGLQEVRVSKVTLADDDTRGAVEVRMTYYLLPSSVVDKHKATLAWERTGELWLLRSATGAFYDELLPKETP